MSLQFFCRSVSVAAAMVRTILPSQWLQWVCKCFILKLWWYHLPALAQEATFCCISLPSQANSPHGHIVKRALRAVLGGSGSEHSDHWTVASLFLMIIHVRAFQKPHCLYLSQEHAQSGRFTGLFSIFPVMPFCCDLLWNSRFLTLPILRHRRQGSHS